MGFLTKGKLEEHDAGGMRRLPLLPGVCGSAKFARRNSAYRILLERHWGKPDAPFLLYIGMNPSTAEGNEDDPTVRIEQKLTAALGFTSYLKANVSAYRCTHPSKLPEAKHPLHIDENFDEIIRWAIRAQRVILTCGTLKVNVPLLWPIAQDLVKQLAQFNVELYCLGTTKDGSPSHPLYLPRPIHVSRWKGWL